MPIDSHAASIAPLSVRSMKYNVQSAITPSTRPHPGSCDGVDVVDGMMLTRMVMRWCGEGEGRGSAGVAGKVKTVSTPIETQKPLLKDENGKELDVHMYRSMIGSLMYLTSSKLDIMYLKGQPKLGLWYPKDSPFDLVAYTDSDYARASLDRKSTT
ncbi:hypothetical protein Tco_0083797 [Tanacetum coccineum]